MAKPSKADVSQDAARLETMIREWIRTKTPALATHALTVALNMSTHRLTSAIKYLKQHRDVTITMKRKGMATYRSFSIRGVGATPWPRVASGGNVSEETSPVKRPGIVVTGSLDDAIAAFQRERGTTRYNAAGEKINTQKTE